PGGAEKGDRHLLCEAGHQPKAGRGPFRQKVPVPFFPTGLAGGDRLTAMLAAFSFTPFLFEGWVSGQICAVAIFCAAAAIYLRQQGREFSAGMVLAVLTFKPTLLLLLLPMLVVTRSFRVLCGVAASGLVLLAISFWAVGYDGCLGFLRFLARYAEAERVAPEMLKSSWKYVDLRSAAYPIFLHPSPWSSAMLAVLVAAAAMLLWRTWRHCTDWRLAWATALIWTPVLSPHCAIYDTVLLIPAVFLAAPAQKSSDWFWPLVMLVYLAAWCSQPIAAMTGFQPLSAAIVLLGLHVCYTEAPATLWRRSRRQTFL
ncbi:MAG: glycosyltransferase 87 family protein, partial [Thermoguttaceae bacterium]